MCSACKAETPCDHPSKDCAAFAGEYCADCQHSPIPPKRRKAAPLGRKRDRTVVPRRRVTQRRSRGR
jgi:hypothetical protein